MGSGVEGGGLKRGGGRERERERKREREREIGIGSVILEPFFAGFRSLGIRIQMVRLKPRVYFFGGGSFW